MVSPLDESSFFNWNWPKVLHLVLKGESLDLLWCHRISIKDLLMLDLLNLSLRASFNSI